MTALKTTHLRPQAHSCVHRARTADLDSNVAFLVGNVAYLTHCLSFWTEESEQSCLWEHSSYGGHLGHRRNGAPPGVGWAGGLW